MSDHSEYPEYRSPFINDHHIVLTEMTPSTAGSASGGSTRAPAGPLPTAHLRTDAATGSASNSRRNRNADEENGLAQTAPSRRRLPNIRAYFRSVWLGVAVLGAICVAVYSLLVSVQGRRDGFTDAGQYLCDGVRVLVRILGVSMRIVYEGLIASLRVFVLLVELFVDFKFFEVPIEVPRGWRRMTRLLLLWRVIRSGIRLYKFMMEE